MNTSSGPTDTVSASVHEFGERWLAGWNTHDPDALAALCHPDIVWDEPAPRRTLRGREELRAWFVQNFVAFPDMHLELEQEFETADGRHAASLWRLTGTHQGPLDPPGFAPTGKRVDIHGADFMTFEDGLLVGMRMIYDVSGLAVQLGLAPAPDSAMERGLVRVQRLAARARR